MHIDIIYCGETSFAPFANGAKEYEKRASAYCNISSVCVKEEYINEAKNISDALIRSSLEAESERMILRSRKGAYKIALCIEGKPLTTEAFSALLEKKNAEGVSAFTFFIGSSHGLSEKLKDSCDFRMSMSPMTFPHQLARLMLSEQIYRVLTIQNGKKYHK